MSTTMTLVSGASAEAIATALADPTFAALDRAGAPVAVAACDTLAILAMNNAAAAAFGGSLEGAAHRLFHGSAPGARRLSTLARTLVTDAAPRLERLRFFAGPAAGNLTVLCRRVAEGALLVLAVPGLRAAPTADAMVQQQAPQDPPVQRQPMLDQPMLDQSTHDVPAQDLPAQDLPVPAGVPTPAPPGDTPRLSAAETPLLRHRFVWRTDRDGRLLDATPPLSTRLRSPVHVTGRPFADILAEAGADTSGTLAQALATRATFSGLAIDWPAADGSGLATVEFGGIPNVSAQQFAGFHGYALVSATVAPAMQETPEPPAPDAPVADAPAPPRISDNVVPIRPLAAVDTTAKQLSQDERSAFEEIARTLSATGVPAQDGDTASQPDPAPQTLPAETPHEETRDQDIRDQDVRDQDVRNQDMRRIVDLVPIGILVSRGGVVIFANRTLLDLTGFADADALHDAGGLDRLFGGADMDASGEKNMAVSLLDSEGETVQVDARVHALQWDGLPATLMSMRRAVDHTAATRAKTLEQDVREREGETRELHAILDTATDGIVLFGPDRAILSLNRSAEALFGCDAADVKGQPLDALVADESRATLSDYLSGVAAGGVASVMNDGREILCRDPRGGLIPVFVTVGRLGAGDAPRFCAVLRDLTAWKDAEQGLTQARSEAERASAQKSEFLARISHEIRTPLNAILGFAEVIMDERLGPLGNERYRDYMKDIHRSGEHVMSLVNDLLDLSKIEAGKMDMTFTAVDANACVSDCVSLMQPQASRARVVIRLSLAPRLPKIVADDRAFRQIVINLLSNAVKYNETGGQVIVSTARTDAGHAIVRIRDTGVGMSESELQVALEPFGQIASSRSTTGTGLGLPLTKALIEANRANFSIKSRKGEGTLVEITFPPSRVMAE